jgi:fibronectin-binding autotransporter adhesin
MKPIRPFRFVVLFGAVLVPAAFAGSLEWAGSSTGLATGASNTWDSNTSANWWDGGSLVTWPALGGIDDDAILGGTAGTVTIAAGGVTANDLTFNTTGYTLAGGTLTLNGATPTLTAGPGVDATISSVIAGSSGLAKAGDGILTLSGANNYTGDTTIGAGILKAGNGAALGANTSGTTVSSGATLDVNGQNLGIEVVTISGAGVGGNGAIINSGGQQINALGRIVLAGDATIGGPNRWDLRNSTPTLNLAGFTLTKTGANYIGLISVAVTPDNGLLTGDIVINQGELNLSLATNLNGSAANSVTVNNGGTLGMYQSSIAHAWTLDLNDGSTLRGENGTGTQNTWAGPVNLSGEVALRAEGVLSINGGIGGTGNLTKIGGNTLTLRGTNTFSGSTTVSAGTLTLDYAINDTGKLDDASALILNGGTVNLAGGTHSEVVASTTLNPGTASTINGTLGASVLQMNTISPGTGAVLNFGAAAIATTDNTNTNGILGPWATVGNDWAVNSTNGADGPITAYSGYTLTSVAGDTAANYANAHIDVDSSPTLDGGISANSIRFNGAAARTVTLTGANNLAAGGIMVNPGVGANASVITGGTLTGGASGDLVINQKNTNAAGALTLGSTIVDNGTTNLVKTGAGTAILTTSNSYSGTTFIGAGSLQINDPNALGGGTTITTSGLNSSALVLGDGLSAGSGKTITIAGGGAGGFFGALSTTGTATWQGDVIIGAATGTRLGTLGTSGALTVAGDISELAGTPSELIIRTNGATVPVILSGNNSYTGGTRLSIGSLRLASTNAIGDGTGNLTISGGTTLSSDGATARNIANNVVLAGNPIFGDATNNGKLTFNGTTDLGGATRTVTVNSEVEFTNTISSSGAFGITKGGNANLILSSPNTYTGPTAINAGTLVVAHKDALAASSSVFPSTTGGGGTLRLATDESVNMIRIETSSSNPGTVVSDRATPGAGISHNLGGGWFGANTYTFAAGANVTSGTAGLTFTSANLTAGSASTAVLNPTTAVVTIAGPVNIGLNNHAKTLRLDGSSSGNLVSGSVSNGLNTLSISKTGASTWELSGVNTYTGTTTVANGTLTLSGNRVANSGGIDVGNTTGQTGILNIQGDLPMAGNVLSVGLSSTASPNFNIGTGIINHSAGKVSFTSNNALLIGRSAPGVSGTYNLSGGELQTFSSASRGVMIGVNDGAPGNPINATFNMSGGTLNNATGTLQVVRGDSTSSYLNSTYNQTGGTSANGTLLIGGNAANGANSTATFSVTGGTFSATGFANLSRGNNVASTMTIGGTAQVTLPAFPTARGTGSTATLVFDGGTLKPAASSGAYLGGLTNAFINAGWATIDTDGKDITISQNLLANPLSPGGGLEKKGGGTLTLTGASTYTSNTIVAAGVLAVNGSVASSVNVSGGATLMGSGAIGGQVVVSGGATLAPGASIESLAAGGLFLLADSVFDYEINRDAVPAAAADLAYLGAGTVSVANGARLAITDLGSTGTWTPGTRLTLVAYTSATAWSGGLFDYYVGNTLALVCPAWA